MKTTLLPARPTWPELARRPVQSLQAISLEVDPIIDRVKREGDVALFAYTREFDHAEVESLEVAASEILGSEDKLDPSLKDAIDRAYENIALFHRAQLTVEAPVEVLEGVHCWRRRVAIERVGLYAPGGSTPLFSTVLMLGIPAQLAGCSEVVLCSPPRPDGSLDPAILYAARKTGITRVFCIGGAQAIAALAHGTKSVPRVDKIFGPGNQYVNAAKQRVALEGAAIDLPAGPSEVLVIADGDAEPDFIAADLLAQAEHGPDSQVMLVTDSQPLAERAIASLESQLRQLPRREIAANALHNARCVVLRDLDEAIDFSNLYAPEHLILMTADPELLAARVTAAGSVFLGAWAPEAAGDYASGTNHTLPTNASARAWSGVSVESFTKNITFQSLTADGLRALAPTVERMAKGEGLEGHAASVTIRVVRIEARS